MKPLRDLLLVEMDVKEEKTQSGIIMAPEKWPRPSDKGTVLACGPKVEGFKEGDRVMINPYAAMDSGEERRKFVHEADILAGL